MILYRAGTKCFLTRMFAARHSDSAVMTKKRETAFVKLQNLASAVTIRTVHMFRIKTAMAHPLSSSMMDLMRVRMMMMKYKPTLV